MRMDILLNRVRAEAATVAESLHQALRIGIVSAYDPDQYAAKVRVQPEPPDQPDGSTETGWLPVLALWGGDGWGDFAPPSPGDVVTILFQEGGREAGIVLGRFFSLVTRPLSVPSGERWIFHRTGAYVKLTNDGKVTVTDKAGSTIVMNGDGTGDMSFANGLTINANVQINGTLTVSENISDLNGAHSTLAALRTAYDTHTHTDSHGDTTGAPDTQV
jgi:phage baseplate assembly protein V